MTRARKKDPPEPKTPARAGAVAGGKAKTSRAAQNGKYSFPVQIAIARYTVGPDMIVQCFAFVMVRS